MRYFVCLPAIYVTVLDWPMKAGPEYGRIHAHLKKKGTRGAARDGRIFEERGTPIGAMDLLIAAHAVTLDAVLVIDNVSEFERVPRRFKVENWMNR